MAGKTLTDKDFLNPGLTDADFQTPGENTASPEAVPQRTVYLDDKDMTVGHPATMSNDQVNDAIQTEVYERPRFNFYQDVAALATGGAPGVVAERAAAAGTEPAKGVVRGGEQILSGIGAVGRWFGENLRREADLRLAEPGAAEGWNDAKIEKIVGDSMTQWGDKQQKYWQQQQQTGVEAADPEKFRGSFLSNPSWTRGLTLIAEAVPALGAAAAVTFATGSPLAGASALGLLQGGEEATNTLEAGKPLDTANAVGFANTVLGTALMSFSLGQALKGGEGKIAQHVFKEALTQGAAMSLQTSLTNVIAKIGYDKTRALLQGTFEAFIAGAGSGGILGGLTPGHGVEIDATIQEAHNAGVDHADIQALREAQTEVIIKNADRIDRILQKEAKTQADKIEVLPDEKLAETQQTENVKVIDDLIAEKEQAAGTDEAAASDIEVLKEMKRQIQLEQKDVVFQEKTRAVEGTTNTKQRINAVTGQRDLSEKRIVSDMQRLKAKLRAEAKGSKAGFKAGRDAGRQQIIEKLNTGELKRDALVDYIKERLPKIEQGKFITMVRDTKNSTDLGKAFSRVDATEQAFNKKALIYDLKDKLARLGKAKNIDVRYKEAIQSAAELLSIVKPRSETIQKLQATLEFIKSERAKGNDVTLPEHVYEALKRLQAVPLADLPIEAVEAMHDAVSTAIETGQMKLQTRQAITELKKENALTELAQGTLHKAEYVPLAEGGITGKLTIDEQFKNVFKNIRNYNVNAGNAMLPMDHFFQAMGEAYHRIIKRPMDLGYRDYRAKYSGVSREVAELNAKLKLNEENFSRMAVHIDANQPSGYEKLINTYSKSAVDAVLSVPLTKPELEMAQLWRKHLDAVRGPLSDFLARVHNKPLGEIPGYFPFKTDYEKTQAMEVGDRIMENFGFKKNVELGFAEARTGVGDQKIRVDGQNIFLEHMDDVYYAIHLGEHIKNMQEMVRGNRFKEAAGDAGQYLTSEWLDLMARKGGTQGNSARGVVDFLNYIRHTTGRASLALNPSSILVQGAGLMDGAGLIGNWAFQGAKDIWSPEWREFIKKNSTALAERMGDDPAYAEFNTNALDKTVFAPTQWTDSKTAAAVFIGAYQKYLSENNLKIDFDKPNVPGILYAEEIVTKTQGGGLFKDLPLMITKGIGLGDFPALAKTVTQFQSPLFFKWANLTSTGARAMKEGNYKLATQIAFYHLAGSASEMMIRNAVKAATLAAVGAVLGVGFKEREDPGFLMDFFETELGNIPTIGNGVSFFAYDKMPAPSLQAAFDLVESGHNAFASDDPEKQQKWIELAGLQLAGVGFGIPLTFKAASIGKQIEE